MKIEIRQSKDCPELLVDGQVVAIPHEEVWDKFDNEIIDTKEKADRFIRAWRRDSEDFTETELELVHTAHRRALNRHYPDRGRNRIGEKYAEVMWM